MYDYLIVGAGLFGSVFAHEARQSGKRCLVIDRRAHVGGNIYTEEVAGIQVHRYGAHIFHTSNREVWDYVRRFADFNHYINSPVAVYGDELYNLPFNMNTFHAMWGVVTPAQAKEKIREQVAAAGIGQPRNLEEQALSLVGRDIYEKLVRGYTEKQWGRPADELPAFIIRRLPVRFTYDNNYFNDRYQGIPVGGYTQIAEKLLEGTEVRLGADFFADRAKWESAARKIVFTGMIDAYYGYRYGALEYRSLRFDTRVLDEENHQGNAVVNYTARDVPHTRVIEHKHFELGCQGGYPEPNPRTVVTWEYPAPWERGAEPYYPVNDEKNTRLYARYRELADKEPRVIFGGRLGMYRYFDMHHVIAAALHCVRQELARS